jgi:hypothetical protein
MGRPKRRPQGTGLPQQAEKVHDAFNKTSQGFTSN